MFGVEVKRGYYAIRTYNRALKQAIDYTHSRVVGVWRGDEFIGSRFKGQRVERVFIYPGAPEEWNDGYDWIAGVNRLAGLFHVGMIYDGPEFYMSAMSVWDRYRTHACHPSRQLIGSGVLRQSATIDLARLFPEAAPPIRRLAAQPIRRW
jgi:hypothetical protein